MTKQFKQLAKNAKYTTSVAAFDENKKSTKIPDDIHLIPIGEWAHDMYGPIIITASDIREFAQNFNAEIRKGVFITAGHEGWDELPAVGWITKVEARDNGLWGTVEWNEYGKGVLTDKQWKFFSPELVRDYEDPENHQLYRNVLTGGALTKSPYFKELQAIMFSEKKLQTNFNDNNTMLILEEVLAKDISTLTDEEKAFVKEHASELTDEQKVTHAEFIKEDEVAETEEEKTAREAAEAQAVKDANVAAGLNEDGSPKDGGGEDAGAPGDDTQINASEKVTIKASELAILRQKADEGAQAFKELHKTKIASAVSSLVFSESNKAGRFLPKSKDNLSAFMESLNDAQRAKFSALITEIPKSISFAEMGGEGNEGNSFAEVESKVEAKMKGNTKLSYSEALKEVMSENEGLEQRYDEGLPTVRAKN